MSYTGKERCCLCGGPLWDGKSEWKGGNDPDPLVDKTGARCCDACNECVIQARLDPRGFKEEMIRVDAAIMAVTNYSGDMSRKAALAAICALRGPDLLRRFA